MIGTPPKPVAAVVTAEKNSKPGWAVEVALHQAGSRKPKKSAVALSSLILVPSDKTINRS